MKRVEVAMVGLSAGWLLYMALAMLTVYVTIVFLLVNGPLRPEENGRTGAGGPPRA